MCKLTCTNRVQTRVRNCTVLPVFTVPDVSLSLLVPIILLLCFSFCVTAIVYSSRSLSLLFCPSLSLSSSLSPSGFISQSFSVCRCQAISPPHSHLSWAFNTRDPPWWVLSWWVPRMELKYLIPQLSSMQIVLSTDSGDPFFLLWCIISLSLSLAKSLACSLSLALISNSTESKEIYWHFLAMETSIYIAKANKQ